MRAKYAHRNALLPEHDYDGLPASKDAWRGAHPQRRSLRVPVLDMGRALGEVAVPRTRWAEGRRDSRHREMAGLVTSVADDEHLAVIAALTALVRRGRGAPHPALGPARRARRTCLTRRRPAEYGKKDRPTRWRDTAPMTSPSASPTQHGGATPPGAPLRISLGRDELVIRRRYEVVSIINDALIGLWFLVGSVLFFFDTTTAAGTWLFVLGSLELLIRPCIRLTRHLHLHRLPELTGGATEVTTEDTQDF